MLFVQFPWPLLAIIEILTKDLHLFSLHNMFRRLAPFSRGVFYRNGKVATLYPRPRESESGGKDLQKPKCLKKNFNPSGVSPLPKWLVPLPVLPQWHKDKDCKDVGAPQLDGGLLVVVGTCEKFEKGQYAFYLIELSRFRQKNKIRQKNQNFIRGGP